MLTATRLVKRSRYCSTVVQRPGSGGQPSRPALISTNASRSSCVWEGRVRAAVDADDLGRDPLPHLGLVPGLGQDHEAGVGVHVDEPGADDAPGRVERAMRLHAVEVPAEQPDPLALDPNRPEVPGVAGAVDDETARNQQIEHGRASGGQSITGARQAAARGGGDGAPSSAAGARSIRAGPPGRARC